MTQVFYWNPAAPTSGKARLTRGEVKAVFDADEVRHLASAGGGDTWWIERRGRQSVVKIPTADYKLSWVDREVEGLKRGACDYLVRLESVEGVTFSIGKRAVITFEYIDGLVVDQAIRTGLWPTLDEVRGLLRGVLSGLAVMHGRDAVHRDVKPANVVLRDGDWFRPVILDLGLTRLLDAKGITKYPIALGTAEFMAPEVIEGTRAERGADLWSLGIVAFILLAHDHPFYGGYDDRVNDVEALERIAAGPREFGADIPPDLRSLVRRWLAVDPGVRGTAVDAIAALDGAPTPRRGDL
jgi:eukaryotic-like serine/threonine-protein kinase